MHQTCQKFFKENFIAQKQYNNAQGQMQERMNNVMTKEWNMYLNAIDAKAAQERKEQQEHIKQVTNQMPH